MYSDYDVIESREHDSVKTDCTYVRPMVKFDSTLNKTSIICVALFGTG